jgi:hypothetical protein
VRSPIQGETSARGTLRGHEFRIRFSATAPFFERRRRPGRLTDGPAFCGRHHRWFGNRRAPFCVRRTTHTRAGEKQRAACRDAHTGANCFGRASARDGNAAAFPYCDSLGNAEGDRETRVDVNAETGADCYPDAEIDCSACANSEADGSAECCKDCDACRDVNADADASAGPDRGADYSRRDAIIAG